MQRRGRKWKAMVMIMRRKVEKMLRWRTMSKEGILLVMLLSLEETTACNSNYRILDESLTRVIS